MFLDVLKYYHLVMTNIAMVKITMLFIGKPYLFRLGPSKNHGYVSPPRSWGVSIHPSHETTMTPCIETTKKVTWDPLFEENP